ncbi:MAG: hypothetical protein IT270_08080 [Saprospiraceae bacterium]|nr:hypothetical protein [Saprospiraceae bacterium]
MPDEAAYRKLFEETYCDHSKKIITFDKIEVSFHPAQFDHAFFESADRKLADKSSFSPVRAERIMWIKDTLEDSTSDLRIGWDKKKKSYDSSRRVAIVKGNYVVVIWLKNATAAKFVTAYEADTSIGKILASPKWTK